MCYSPKPLKMSNNISRLFFESCQKHPDRIAIIEREQSITYAELNNQIAQTVLYFREKGIQPGDRVLVFVPMSIDLYRITLALFSMGATAVFLDEWVSLKRLKLCCEIADCKAFIAPRKIRFLAFFISTLRRIPIHLSATKRSNSVQPLQVHEIEKDHPALITFTTGSVGTPKAAVRSHDFLRIQFEALNPLLANGNQREMIMLPIVLLLNLAAGKTSILADFKFSKPHTFNPQRIHEQLVEHQIEGLVASPHYMIALAKFRLNQNSLNPLKTIVSGGSAIFPNDAKLVLQAFQHTNFTVVFGSTEAEPISHCSAEALIENQEKVGVFVGEIDPVAEVKIIQVNEDIPHEGSDLEFEKMILPLGETGEILVKGEHVLSNYLNGEEILKKNKIKTPSGLWHRTGDAGYLENEHTLYLMGRVHQIFSIDGVQVYPFVAEKIIREIEEVSLGTILEINNKAVLVYQASRKVEEQIFRDKFKELNLSSILKIDEIPVDPRHRSKIEYAKLREQIKPLMP